MLRCRPGDLCMVTGSTSIEWKRFDHVVQRIEPVLPFGTLLTVVELIGDDLWKPAEDLRVTVLGEGYLVDGIADDCLTPLRPQPDRVDLEAPADLECNFG